MVERNQSLGGYRKQLFLLEKWSNSAINTCLKHSNFVLDWICARNLKSRLPLYLFWLAKQFDLTLSPLISVCAQSIVKATKKGLKSSMVRYKRTALHCKRHAPGFHTIFILLRMVVGGGGGVLSINSIYRNVELIWRG